MKLFRRILIANRGEIAVRIIRSAKYMGIKTVALYSEVDSDSLHVQMADEAHCIGKVELSDTYLNIDKIVDLARRTNCDAIHPGYGFLAENPVFMHACDKAGISFIGPNETAIRMMGNKIESRDFVKKLGVPLTEGITGDTKALLEAGKKIPFPLLVKAAAGGGGKGMRIVYDENELSDAIEATAREAKTYFGDETIFVEKFVENPRHIEIQVLGDNFGNVVHLFERECSIQRRYQKIVEEAPSVTLTPEVRKAMGECAVRIAKEIKYNSVGTIEFLVDKNLDFYFLEMNTRIQVEHPVTEMTTNVDLISEQIMVAAGNELTIMQDDLDQYGHAIECRIYAEDPANNFMPSPGKMDLYREPENEDVRIDTGITSVTEIKSFFDPMISKLIVWGDNRDQARLAMIDALKEYAIHGIKTNIPYLIKIMENEAYRENSISTKFCDEYTQALNLLINEEQQNTPIYKPLLSYVLYSISLIRNYHDFEEHDIWNIIGYWRNQMQCTIKYLDAEYIVDIKEDGDDYCFVLGDESFSASVIEIDSDKIVCIINDEYYTAYISENEQLKATVSLDGHIYEMKRTDLLSAEFSASFDDAAAAGGDITAPMPGKVIKINVSNNDEVSKGAVLMVIEAMKMENSVCSPLDGIIDTVNVKLGDMVETSTQLVLFKEKED